MTYPQRVVVDRVPPLRDVQLEVRCDTRPTGFILQPVGSAVPFAWDAVTNTARLQIASVGIHDIVVVL